MAKKRTITPEFLEDLEEYAKDHYTLSEAMEELNVSLALLQDEQVQQAFNRGLVKQYIENIITGDSYDDIITSYSISLDQCEQWAETYKDEIDKGKAKQKEKLLNSYNLHSQDTPQRDDITVMGLKFC